MAEIDTPVEEQIVGVLRRLGIERAHFASRNLGDWHGLAVSHPEAIASLTLVCPLGFDAAALEPLGDRLLVFNAGRRRLDGHHQPQHGRPASRINGHAVRLRSTPTTTPTLPSSGATNSRRPCWIS